MSQTQLRQATISSQVQAQARAIQSMQQEQAKQSQEVRTEQAQTISKQTPKLSSKEIEELIWYPWGEKFASLPKSTQQELERLHQDAIGGVLERKNYVPTQSEILQYNYDVLRGGDATKLILPESIVTPKQIPTTTIYYGGKEYRNVPKEEAQRALTGDKEAIKRIKSMEGKPYIPSKNVKVSIVKQTLPSISTTSGVNIDRFGRTEVRDTSGKLVGYESKGQTIPVGDFAQRVDEAKKRQVETNRLINSETKRYQDLGYNKTEATNLAKSSVYAGGVTYTKERAKELTPQQRVLFGITGMSMSEAKKAEAETLKKYNVTTNIRETEFYNKTNAGGYFPGGSELEVRPVEPNKTAFSIFGINIKMPSIITNWERDTSQNITQSHEFAHKLDKEGKLNASISFKKASGGIDEPYYKEYYGKDYEKMIEGEYKAKAYENYIGNPEKFAKKFPKEAEVFNKAIGYTLQPQQNIFMGVGNVIKDIGKGVGEFGSLVKTVVTGVKQIKTQTSELKSDVLKAGDTITQGELSNVNKGVNEVVDYGTKKAEQTLWNKVFGGGITGNVVNMGTSTKKTNVVTPYQQSVKDYGVYSGTSRYIGEESKKLVPNQQLSVLSDYYGYERSGTYVQLSQEERQRREGMKTSATREAFSSTVQSIPYFTPVGATLMVVSGVEQLAYKKPREELYQTAEKVGLPKQVGLLLPAAQIGLGLFGLRTQAKRIETKRIGEEAKKQFSQLEQYKYKVIQPEKGVKFITFAQREGGNLKQVVYGAGTEKKAIGKSIISGNIEYRNILGIKKEVPFYQENLFLSGTKVLPKSIKQYKDITKSIIEGKSITPQLERQLSYTESLSQPTKLESITKVRTPNEFGFIIKIPEEIKIQKGIPKSPLSKTFGEQLNTQELIKPSPTTKLVIPKIKPEIKSQKPIESNYPTYVGGTKLIGAVTTIGKTIENPITLTVPKGLSLSLTGNVVQEPRIVTSIKSVQTTTQDLGLKQKQETLPKVKTNLNYLSLLKSQQVPKLKEEQLTKQTQVQQTKQEQLQKLKTRLLTKQISKIKEQKIKVPKPIPPISPILFGRKPTAKEVLGEEFEVYIGKKGKERKIGEEFDILKAGKRLKIGLQSGLEAGGTIVGKKTGRKVRYEEIADILGAEFRPSVATSERIIQRKEKVGLFGSRLGSQKERKLIQLAKGKKSKGWF